MAKVPKGTGIEIRRFTTPDLHATKNLIHSTIKTCYLGVYPKAAIKFFLDYHNDENILKDAKKGYTIVLEKNGQIIGTGTIVTNHICRVFVKPALQKQGLGKLIMQKLEAKAVSNKIRLVDLHASLPSKKFYDTLCYTTVEKGFREVENGEKLHYYIMEKSLRGN